MIIIPLLIIVFAGLFLLTVALNSYSEFMDAYYGRGRRIVANPASSAAIDYNYYNKQFYSSDESKTYAAGIAGEISAGGQVLLKNDGALPLDKATPVTPFGYRYIDPVYGGFGSSSVDTTDPYIVTPEEGLDLAFENINTEVVDKMKKAKPVANNPKDIAELKHNPYIAGSGYITLYEYDSKIYSGSEGSCNGTVGLVFIGRTAGEGDDLYYAEYSDGTPHALALTVNEKNMIAFAKQNCKSVVVVLEIMNPFQLAELAYDEGINAILLVGGGCAGYETMGKIFTGNITPSGRLSDIFPADLTKDPTYSNFNTYTGESVYSNCFSTWYETSNSLFGTKLISEEINVAFREQEEGVYIGYKYYETASQLSWFDSDILPPGHIDSYYNQSNGVVYPFGFGLSYTRFEQNLVSLNITDSTVTLEILIENIGDVSGKEVVQVYFSPPYTQFDVEYKIEKPAVNLIAFKKTDELAPGEKQQIKISFNTRDMASYCYTRANDNGTVGSYVLEDGDYTISLRSDSHTVIAADNITAYETVWYDGGDNEIATTNRFDNANLYMSDHDISNATILSRNAWDSTQPTALTEADKIASDTVIEWNKIAEEEFDPSSDKLLGDNEGSLIYKKDYPVSQEDKGLLLSHMRGISYDSSLWDDFIGQLNFNDAHGIKKVLSHNTDSSSELQSIGKPIVINADGTQGLTQAATIGRNTFNCCAYPPQTTLAQAWDIELAEKQGYAIGQEALTQEINGWYGPGLNIHRSPFGGRNFDYYSEDALLSGKLGAAVISGAGACGLISYAKHFAFYDQENDRGQACYVWATEQAFRETYLKSFEIVVKEAKSEIKYVPEDNKIDSQTINCAFGIMVGSCAPGGVFCGWNYDLLTGMLREEWGFKGVIITDMGVFTDWQIDKMLRAGCDTLMSIDGSNNFTSINSATGQWAIRSAIKNYCYVIANSNVMQGAAPGALISYGMPAWRVTLIVIDIIVGLLITGTVIYLIIRNRKKTI